MTHDFPTTQEVITIHEVLIEEFGGAPGIRDEADLISALMRPQLGYYDTLIQEAAALMGSLANNHPFVDGNKRVAFFVTDTFLRMNGYYIDCDNEELTVITKKLMNSL
jgi:death on curing protein